MTVALRWLGTSCFQMVLPNDVHIMLDPHMDHSPDPPVTSDQIERCDYLFLTHGHWDHVLDVGKLAGRLAPPIFCNQATAAAIVEHQKVDRRLIHEITIGDVVAKSGFSVEVRRGVHVNQAREYRRLTGRDLPGEREIADPFERLKAIVKASTGTDRFAPEYPAWRRIYPGGEQLNFIFEAPDGQRIFVAGTYPEPEMITAAKTARADITLLQCMSGGKLAGIEQQTADLAIASGCRTAVPQHHDPLHKGARQTDLTVLKRIFKAQTDIAFVEMTPGDWYTFEDGVGKKMSEGLGVLT